MQMAAWVRDLAPWQYMSTLTFRWEASLASGIRCYERFMRKHLPHASYFYALEQNPSRDGFHVHALWADLPLLYRKEPWCAWFQRYGRALIEPVRKPQQAEDYVAKYCTKENSWYNVFLQWHRRQALTCETFKLR